MIADRISVGKKFISEGRSQCNWMREGRWDDRKISGLKVEKKYVLNKSAEEEVKFEFILSR